MKKRIPRPSITQPEDPMVRHIALTQGYVAIVDVADYEWLDRYNWHTHIDSKTRKPYAMRATPGQHGLIGMHRAIMNPPEGFFPDHIRAKDTLDNRRSNLRLATNSQNVINKVQHKVGVSGYRGVKKVFHKGNWNGTYRSSIQELGKRKHLGVFKTAELAARAYDAEAKIQYGVFACLNFQ